MTGATLIRYCILQAAFLACVTWYLSRNFVVDDAFISLRYAQNLLDGLGMVWQPGERVEGYTNFLLIILTAGLGRLGIDLLVADRLIGFAAYFALLFVLAWYVRLWPLKRAVTLTPAEKNFGVLTVSLAASATPLLAWCLGGLEANLFACLLTLGLVLVLEWLSEGVTGKQAMLAGAAFALAAMTRPEGTVFFGYSVLFLFFLAPPYRARLIPLILAFALIFVPYTLWRVSYFGEWLPNTYYAKIFGVPGEMRHLSGFFYLLQFALLPPMWIICDLVLGSYLARRTKQPPGVIYLLGFLLLFAAFILHSGGDFMPYFRFMVPAIPALLLLIHHWLLALLDMGKTRLVRDVVFALLFFPVFAMGGVEEDKGYTVGALSSAAVGDYLRENWKEGSVVALNPAGLLPYIEPQFHYVDMLGLLDKTIARRTVESLPKGVSQQMGHVKGDGAYVLSRKPDYILFGLNWGSPKPVFASDFEIEAHPDFKKHYRKVESWVTPPPGLLPQLKQAYAKKAEGLILSDKGEVRLLYFARKK